MKFFNKGFLKSTIGFLCVIAVSLLIIAAVSTHAAGVENMAFTTEEQSVKPNEISGPLTIQTQDSSGASIQTPETIDLEFISSSPTGEFLNSSGNAISTTMSKNTANRTFYYRDSNEGNFLITVKARGRDSFEEWSTSQNINVSPNSAAISSSQNNQNQVGTGSTTSGPASVSNSNTTASTIEVSAGPDRLTSPGSPLTFQVNIKKNTVSSGLTFSWSFGDGLVGEGDTVTHMYKYPGDYAVVLNARAGKTYAVSRLKVKVIEPKISVSANDEYVEIKNTSTSELNLFNWKVTNGKNSFIFQPDTIVLANSSIKIPNQLLNMKSSEDSGLLVTNFAGDTVAKNTVALVEVIPNQPITYKLPSNTEAKAETVIESAVLGTTTEQVIYEASEETGVLGRIWQFLVSVVD